MRRRLNVLFVIIFAGMIIALNQTATDPEEYSGIWYSSDQCMYLFQEGMIYSSEHMIPLSETEYFCGAYSYCRDSVVLFAEGIAELEKEKELYLFHSGDGSFLCENRDGTGKIYFMRYNK